MRGLVDEFSRFARLPVLQPVVSNINETIREAAALFSGRSDLADDLEMDLEPDLLEISYDREHMRRVMINLLENAYQAVRDRGQGGVGVTTKLLVDEGMVSITVSDEGKGVDEELHDRIFEPYFSTKKDGTGLGLAITQRIVEEHGGEITYEMNMPMGSVFTVKIPVNIEPRPRR